MTYKVKILSRAKQDLVDVYDQIHAESVDAARTWYRMLTQTIQSLKTKPHRCPVTTEDKNLRHLLYGNRPHIYRVIYHIREKQNEVAILHIRHGARSDFKSEDLN